MVGRGDQGRLERREEQRRTLWRHGVRGGKEKTMSYTRPTIRLLMKVSDGSSVRGSTGGDGDEVQHRHPVAAGRTAPAGWSSTRRVEPVLPLRLFGFVVGSEAEMVREELAVRLNDGQYKNWLKAGRCLLILKEALHPFTDSRMRALHGDLLHRNSLLRRPCETSSCRPAGNKLPSVCRACSEWRKVILTHHRQPDATINWANCSPPHWRTDHWELAKAYMPRGLAKVKRAEDCDASALLNLINYCKYFSSVDPKLVRQVIQYRNELMHSCEFRVKDDWMRHYRTALRLFVQQFSQVPQMAASGEQIEGMLSVDLSICVRGVDRMDYAGLLDGLHADSVGQLETSAELISQWETELLQEMLQECLHATPEEEEGDDGAKAQDSWQLKRLGGFLQANKDLSERFSTQLQAINSLESS